MRGIRIRTRKALKALGWLLAIVKSEIRANADFPLGKLIDEDLDDMRQRRSSHRGSDCTVRSQYNWLAPVAGQAAYEPTDSDWKSFATLAEFQKATGQETHGIEVDYDLFENLSPPDPGRRHEVYRSMDLNFQLKAGSKAVDAGVRILTVNDNFTGDAPDLGALEAGKPEPHYGPRWLKAQPFYR